MPLKINFKSILLYAVFLAAFIFSNGAVRGVPFSLGILFAALLCGTNVNSKFLIQKFSNVLRFLQ